MINNLVDMAIGEKDHASNTLLQWFVVEQTEEEMSVDEYVHKFKLAGNSPEALLILDRELGGRSFTIPASKSE